MPVVIKCRNCYSFQMSTASKVVNCVSCDSTFQIQNVRIYFQSDSPQACTEVVKKLKEEQFKVDDRNFGEDDFFTYQVERN